MANELVRPVASSELANALGLRSFGADTLFNKVHPLDSTEQGGLRFSKVHVEPPLECVLIAPSSQDGSWIESKSPRLDFARALAWLDLNVGFKEYIESPVIHPTAVVGSYCVIGNGVRIGAHTRIGNHVTIGSGVIIGERCTIKSGAVIGEDGFGFERDENGLPLRLVHLGGVLIGDDVEIGSLTTVCRGTLKHTIIEDFAKIDDHVHVAHNVVVRRGAMVIACAELSGGVDVGEFSWIGPNASVIQQRKIGYRSLIGIAANVLKDVPDGATVVGNPGRLLDRS